MEKSKKLFDETAKVFKVKLQKVNKIVADIYDQLDDIKSMYNLNASDLEDLEKVNNDLYKVNNEFNTIVGDLKNKTVPYSRRMKLELKPITSGTGGKIQFI